MKSLGTSLLADLESLGDHASDLVVASDLDGTLAPIVANPAEARPTEGSMDCLGALSRKVREVAIISGRPISFLERFAPPGVSIFGLYGLEVRRFGERSETPEAERWREAVANAESIADEAAVEGLVVEPKGLSMTLHYRGSPQAEEPARELAEEIAESTGLLVRSAKASLELHPPVNDDKGTVLLRVAGETGGVFFAGDDLGDLPAFRTVQRLGESGRRAMSLAVSSKDTPAEVLTAADHVVSSPDELLTSLRALEGFC